MLVRAKSRRGCWSDEVAPRNEHRAVGHCLGEAHQILRSNFSLAFVIFKHVLQCRHR